LNGFGCRETGDGGTTLPRFVQNGHYYIAIAQWPYGIVDQYHIHSIADIGNTALHRFLAIGASGNASDLHRRSMSLQNGLRPTYMLLWQGNDYLNYL
jgi:hypothetical protein